MIDVWLGSKSKGRFRENVDFFPKTRLREMNGQNIRGVTFEYEPFTYTNEEGKYDGFEVNKSSVLPFLIQTAELTAIICLLLFFADSRVVTNSRKINDSPCNWQTDLSRFFCNSFYYLIIYRIFPKIFKTWVSMGFCIYYLPKSILDPLKKLSSHYICSSTVVT